MSREAFATWWGKDGIESPTIHETGAAWKTWKARQPEIEELRNALESAEIALTVFCGGDDWVGTMPGDALKEVRNALDKVKK